MEIVSKFNTVTKALTVTVDGKTVDNVSGYEAYRDYSDDDSFTCCLTTRVNDENNKCTNLTRLCASESLEAKANKAIAFESKDLPGFMIVPSLTKTQVDIAKCFAE